MNVIRSENEDGTFLTVVASIPTEDVVVRASVDYVPRFVTDTLGKTSRVTKDVTLVKLLKILRHEFPDHELVSLGTPVNFDVAPTHLTRVEMNFETEEQVTKCLKEISVSDMLIRSRVQPAWDWKAPITQGNSIVLHVGWYDTVYFMQFKDIFLGDLHCRYSAKFGFDPNDAKITHYRYDEHGDIQELLEWNDDENYAISIKDQVEFIRIFRDGSSETT